VGRKYFLACTRWLWQVVEDRNLLHALFVLYAIPLILGFVILCVGFVALALSDPGFAELLLFTAILGLIIGLPEALGR
jgi:hypothetical protein